MGLNETLNSEIKQNNVWVFVLVILVGTFFSQLIPPFQSPDEFAHIQRAYLLSKGQTLLESPPGQASGGYIDAGLIAYFSGHQDLPQHPGKKFSRAEESSVLNIDWAGKRTFSEFPNTGYYFPLAYAPQAFGLWIGEALRLTVDDSYRLARFFVLTFSAVFIAAAFSITPVNAFVLGLLIIPMSIFQFSSASLDAFTTALTLFCVSLFMRGSSKKYDFPAWMSYLLAACLLILATSRIHLLPLLGLPLFLWTIRRSGRELCLFLVITGCSLLWTFIAIKTTVGNNTAASGHSVAQYISYYAQSPKLLTEVFFNTISEQFGMYKISLIGVLGWLDTPFTQKNFYSIIFNCLIFAAIFSITIKDLRDEWRARLALVILSILSILLVFFAMLVGWNPLPTGIIAGVQGRYFIGPLIVFGYALSGSNGSLDGKWGRFGVVPLVIIGFMVATNMPKLLVGRYYMTPHEIADVRLQVKPGALFKKTAPFILSMTELHKNESANLLRMGVMFWNKNKQSLGEAELKLKGPNGAEFSKRFPLRDLVNNEYYYFELDPNRYTYGEISLITGGDISVWESHNGDGNHTCIIYEYGNGKKRFTPGCLTF